MQPLKSILVIAERSVDAPVALQRALVIARYFDADIELLACDPVQPWFARADSEPGASARAATGRDPGSRRFLDALLSAICAPDLQIRTSDDCEAPLHAGIATKVRAAGHGLVVKHVLPREGRRRVALSPSECQLILACPAPLMLTRGRPWRPLPRFVARPDEPAAGDSDAGCDAVVALTQYLADGCRGVLERLHDDAPVASPGRAGADPALAALRALGDIDMVVLRSVDREGSVRPTGAGPSLAGKIVEAFECDVLLMPQAPWPG